MIVRNDTNLIGVTLLPHTRTWHEKRKTTEARRRRSDNIPNCSQSVSQSLFCLRSGKISFSRSKSEIGGSFPFFPLLHLFVLSHRPISRKHLSLSQPPPTLFPPISAKVHNYAIKPVQQSVCGERSWQAWVAI